MFDPSKRGQVIESDEMRGGNIGMLKKSSEFRTNAHIGFRNVEKGYIKGSEGFLRWI